MITLILLPGCAAALASRPFSMNEPFEPPEFPLPGAAVRANPASGNAKTAIAEAASAIRPRDPTFDPRPQRALLRVPLPQLFSVIRPLPCPRTSTGGLPH